MTSVYFLAKDMKVFSEINTACIVFLKLDEVAHMIYLNESKHVLISETCSICVKDSCELEMFLVIQMSDVVSARLRQRLLKLKAYKIKWGFHPAHSPRNCNAVRSNPEF